MRPPHEPFLGEPPATAPGVRVLCRTAFNEWVPKVAMSAPRYDDAHANRTCWLSVAVATPQAYEQDGENAEWVNWPAEDVRPDDR